MYDMPLNGDAVLVENGAVTRVNRIVRSIERTPALAQSYKDNGLTKDLIITAIGQVETNRVARYGARTAGGRFADRYSPGVNDSGKKSPFRRGAGDKYSFAEGKKPIVNLSPGVKLRIADFLGVKDAYQRGMLRKRGYLYGRTTGLQFGVNERGSHRDASGALLAKYQQGGYATRGAASADAAYREAKKDLREQLRSGKIKQETYSKKLRELRAGRADVQAAATRRQAEDHTGNYFGVQNLAALAGERGFRGTGPAAKAGAAAARARAGDAAGIKFKAKTAKGKTKQATVLQVLSMPQMFTPATVKQAQDIAWQHKQDEMNVGHANPFNGLGDLALVSNPSGIALLDTVEGAVAKVPVVGEYVAPVIAPVALGAVGFGAHFLLVPRLRPYLPAGVLQDWAATVIGVAGAVASLAVYKMSSNQTTRNAALAVGGTVAATGIILDLNKKYGGDLGGHDEFGAVALENPSLGAVALENPSSMFGAVALENPSMFGDGMAYQLSPVGFGFDGEISALQNSYGRASGADAYYSGPDFDSAEGEALLAGAGEFGRAAGPVPRLAAGQHKHHSEFAGRRFHRWAWLIKLVGFQNAQQIASLPPEERLKVIDSLRKQALQAYQQYLASHKVSESLPAGIAAGGPLAPAAAPGVGDAFGYGALAVSDY
jgi:hypothetical protein